MNVMNRGEAMFEEITELIKACPEKPKKKLGEVMERLEGLINTMGFCSKDPMPRDCNKDQAMMCVLDMVHSLLEAEKTGFMYSMCS
jgi:hypothetical protein